MKPPSPEAETFLAFKRAMETKRKKNTDICVVLQKTFNMLHLGICMVTTGHFITIKIFREGSSWG